MSEISSVLLYKANKTSKTSDMAKVAIKSENISPFGGICHVMNVFSKFGFETLTETVLGKRGCSGKAYSYGSIFVLLFFCYLCGGDCLEDINTLEFCESPTRPAEHGGVCSALLLNYFCKISYTSYTGKGKCQ